MDYFTYVSNVADFSGISRAHHLSKSYQDYLAGLVGYLESFYERTQPLGQLRKQFEKVGCAGTGLKCISVRLITRSLCAQLEREFDEKWDAGAVAGWQDPSQGLQTDAAGALDLEAFDSAEELEMLGASSSLSFLRLFPLRNISAVPSFRLTNIG